MANIDAIEQALCARYNVAALDGELAEAVKNARAGDLSTLTAALAERELYQWRGVIEDALAADVESEPEDVTKVAEQFEENRAAGMDDAHALAKAIVDVAVPEETPELVEEEPEPVSEAEEPKTAAPKSRRRK